MAAETAEKEEEEARRAADATATALREELAQKQAELDALVVFRERQPVLEGELAEIRQLVAHQQATQREREHELNVRAWKQREALNEEMLSRIAQAKENFLDLTDSMLDKTAQRTIHRGMPWWRRNSMSAASSAAPSTTTTSSAPRAPRSSAS